MRSQNFVLLLRRGEKLTAGSRPQRCGRTETVPPGE
jgi:hypothetical protein